MKITRKIKAKTSTRLIPWLIRFSVKINSPFLTALAFAAVAKGSSVAKSSDKGRKYKVLCLGRTIFADDVKALAEFGRDIKYYVVWITYFQVLFQSFADKEEYRKLNIRNYFTTDICKDAKVKYYGYLKRMLPWLKKFIGFDAVMSGNYCYKQQNELAKLCEEEKIPFIVLHKEGIAMGGFHDMFKDYYTVQQRFIGAKMLFYNNRIKQVLLDNKLQGLTQENCEVVGIPRFDSYFLKKKNSGRHLVFFAFNFQYEFSHLINNKKRLEEVYKISEDFYKAIVDFAIKHKDIKVIIKTKAGKVYLDHVKNFIKNNYKEKINNLAVVNKGSVADLILDSIAVIGFNTSTLFEALIADKIIISPFFGSLIDNKSWDYFTDYPELINYANNLSQLEEIIFSAKKYQNVDQEKKEKCLKHILPSLTGDSCQNTERAIMKTIKEYDAK